MNWEHVKLIFEREVRDQLRDRRTMFTIFILPILLYPLMGIVLFEVAQFPKQKNVTIGVVGKEHLPESVGLVQPFDSAIVWKSLAVDATLVKAFSIRDSKYSESPDAASSESDILLIEQALRSHDVDLLVAIPADFSHSPWETPLHVVSNQRWERSLQAASLFQQRVSGIHRDWVRSRLEKEGVSPGLIEPPAMEVVDVAPPELKRAVIWSKILPFIMLVWALTGAFYPAVDLCAGEKERGTLETLLSGPANRRDIVWGKLLTILCFSVSTALLNLVSMYTTAALVMTKFQGHVTSEMVSALGPLPIHSMLWLIGLVVPMSAMFSALALAVASLARSTKEGQYYLMPLLLVGMPLVMLPMIPGVVLAPGTSVIPVTGAILISKTLMDGDYLNAFLHLPTVVGVTVMCTLLATRWAVRQFESESVMFRDGNRTSIRNWLRNAWRQRDVVPTVSESAFCGLIILVTLFFGRLSMSNQEIAWGSIVKSTLTLQIGLMLAPALIMATVLTRSVLRSLRLNPVKPTDLIAAGLLAIALHPTYTLLATAIGHEYRLGEETVAMLKHFDGLLAAAPVWSVLIVMALVPAICEELVFRGFVFSGLERNEGQLRAILLSATLFGLSHGVLQQTITASLMGLLLGWIAFRTRGVVCGILFHFVHNSLSMLIATHSSRGESVPSWMNWAVVQPSGSPWAYTELWTALSIIVSFCLIVWMQSIYRPNVKSRKRTHPASVNAVVT